MILLEVNSVSRSFGGLKAVQGVSLKIKEGTLTALIGPNGAGKTTLFSLMSGFIKPDSGDIVFKSQNITGLTAYECARRGLTRTFQIVQPFAAQTVRENICVGAYLHHPSKAQALARAEEVAHQVGLFGVLDQAASQLTVAGRKRLELARALATDPQLLLLDEVLAGLNPSEIQEMIPVIRSIVSSGVTVLMIEHVMQAVMSLAQYAWVLSQGQLIAEGTPKEVSTDTKVIEAYLGHGMAKRIAQGQMGVEKVSTEQSGSGS
jgi:branched-chain amino acid transport system ATP-binding protein